MKPQDVLFFLVFLFFLYKRNSRWLAIAGLVCLGISIPLFAKWVFFTAERLTWYAGAFFLLEVMLLMFKGLKNKSHSGANPAKLG